MFRFLVLSGLVLTVAANNSSCGTDSAKVPDCQLTDLGSCGNACCTLALSLPLQPEDLYTTITDYLKKGGSDGSYTYKTGPDAAGHNPGDDLRKFNITYQYIFQGTHETTGGYIDTLDFNIAKTPNSAVLTMFSSSGIHGALGDHGQNYKTLAFLSKDLGWAPKFFIVHGCGKKHGAADNLHVGR